MAIPPNFTEIKIMNEQQEKICPICYGDGYVIETHDADSTHRECCPCSAGTMTHMVDSGHAEKMNGEQVGEMLATIGCEQALKYTPEEAKTELREELRMCFLLQPYGFTADDLRDRLLSNCPAVLDVISPNSIGAVFREASKKGLIVETGDRIKSHHPSTHGRKQTVWRRK